MRVRWKCQFSAQLAPASSLWFSGLLDAAAAYEIDLSAGAEIFAIGELKIF